jgi:hypothetical protein
VIQEVVAGPLGLAELADVLDGDKRFAAGGVVRQRQDSEAERDLAFAFDARVVNRERGAGAGLGSAYGLKHGRGRYGCAQRLPEHGLGRRGQQGQSGVVGVSDHLVRVDAQDAKWQPIDDASENGGFEARQDVAGLAGTLGGFELLLGGCEFADQQVPRFGGGAQRVAESEGAQLPFHASGIVLQVLVQGGQRPQVPPQTAV